MNHKFHIKQVGGGSTKKKQFVVRNRDFQMGIGVAGNNCIGCIGDDAVGTSSWVTKCIRVREIPHVSRY